MLKFQVKSKFVKSLRFRILIILIVMGTVPSLVITQSLMRAYENRAISLRTSNVRNQCDILCNQLVHDGYMENPDSDVISGKLDLLANMYLGRILVINKDFRIIKDT